MLSANKPKIEQLSDNAASLKASIRDFAGDRATFQGMSAIAMGDYLIDIHGILLDAWVRCMALWEAAVTDYLSGLEGLGGHDGAVVETYYLDDYASLMDQLRQYYEMDESDIIRFTATYGEFLQRGRPLMDDLYGSLSQARDLAERQKQDLSDLDARFFLALDEVEVVLNAIETACQSTVLRDGSVTQAGLKLGNIISSEVLIVLMGSDEYVDYVYQHMLNDDGTVNREAARNLVCRGESIKPEELEALIRLIDRNCSYEDLLFIFRTSVYGPESPTIIGDTAILPLGGYFDTEDSAAVRAVISMVAEAFISMTSDRATNALIANWPLNVEFYGSEEYELVKRTLALGQILMFLDNCDRIAPELFDLSGMGDPLSPRIIYEHDVYQASNINQLLNTTSDVAAGDGLNDYIKAVLASYEIDKERLLFDVVIELLGYFPLYGTAMSIAGSCTMLMDFITDCKDLDDATRSALLMMLLLGTVYIGGGYAYVQTPKGFIPTGLTTATGEAVVRLAGMEHDLDFIDDPAKALLILGSSDDPDYVEARSYLEYRVGSDYYMYKERLTEIYINSYSYICEEMGADLCPDPSKGFELEYLPIEIIELLVELEKQDHNENP